MVVTILPGQLREFGLAEWASVAFSLVNITGAVFQPFVRRISDHHSLGIALLLSAGTVLRTVGTWTGNIILLLLSAAGTGAACYGFTYLGGLAIVSKLGGERRAGAVAGYYLFAYLGYGLPSVADGYLSDAIGTLPALIVFGVIVLLACLVLAFYLHRQGGRYRSSAVEWSSVR